MGDAEDRLVMEEFAVREAVRRRRADHDAIAAERIKKEKRVKKARDAHQSIPRGVQDARSHLHHLLKERDDGFPGDKAGSNRTQRAVRKARARIAGDDPRWSTIGRGYHVPEHKKEEYEIRRIVRDMLRILDE